MIVVALVVLTVVGVAGATIYTQWMNNNTAPASKETDRSFANDDKPSMPDSLEAELETVQIADPTADFAEIDKDIKQL